MISPTPILLPKREVCALALIVVGLPSKPAHCFLKVTEAERLLLSPEYAGLINSVLFRYCAYNGSVCATEQMENPRNKINNRDFLIWFIVLKINIQLMSAGLLR